MKLTTLKTKIENTAPVNKMGYCPVDENHKQNMLGYVNYMLGIIGDHIIPKTQEEYADLLDSLVGEDCTDDDAIMQMDTAKQIISLNRVFNN